MLTRAEVEAMLAWPYVGSEKVERLARDWLALEAAKQRQADATDNLIRQAIATADFIEGEYADGNDDGDIIPISSPAYKVHKNLWGAILKADLPDGAVTLKAAEAAAALAKNGGK